MKASVVVVGAGIAGVSTAYHLAVELGVRNVVLCDPLPPLTLTSDKSTECYRNWWPSAPMVSIMNRAIDLLELYDRRSGRSFNLNRRGYLYVTADADRLEGLIAEGTAAMAHGAGELRVHTDTIGYRPHTPDGVPAIDGADVLDQAGLKRYFPYVSDHAIGALHARRAGWMSAQQLGAWMLEEAGRHGVRSIRRRVTAIDVDGSGVSGVMLDDGTRISSNRLVNAAGPMIGQVGAMAEVEVPVRSEAHVKVAFRDPRSAVPRHAPMLIWCDPQEIGWTGEERRLLTEIGRDDLVGTMPPFCHGRPEGTGESTWVVALWEYDRTVTREPVWPMPSDEMYPETVLRGMSSMVPALTAYLDHLPQPFVDGGYYNKAPDNRPLIGPMGPEGAYICGALSGFGIMVAAAAGELAALHVTGSALPSHAPAFDPSRFDDPLYAASTPASDAGQL